MPIHKLVKLGFLHSVTYSHPGHTFLPSLEIPPANKGAMQMAEVVEYLKPPDAACDASHLSLLMVMDVYTTFLTNLEEFNVPPIRLATLGESWSRDKG